MTLALVVRERRRRKRECAVASRVEPRAVTPALEAEARTEMLADALAKCLFRELTARREPPQVAEKDERPTAGETQPAV